MTAFFKRNGAWLLLAVVLLALLISLPYIEIELKSGVVFTIYLENRASIGIDGVRLSWSLGDREGVKDALNHIDLVQSKLMPGDRMSIDFTRGDLDGGGIPAHFHADIAVLDELNFRLHEVHVKGKIDLDVAEKGEYVIVLDGTPGTYSIRQGD